MCGRVLCAMDEVTHEHHGYGQVPTIADAFQPLFRSARPTEYSFSEEALKPHESCCFKW